MSRLELQHTHAAVLRARAALLMQGNPDAQRHACEMETEADSIDPQRAQSNEEES